MSKSVSVETDDPENPKISLTLSANVVIEMGFEQSYIRFYDIAKGETKTERTRIMVAKPDDVTFGKVTAKLDGLTAKVVKEKGEKGETQFFVEATYKADKVGSFSGTIEIETNHPKYPKLTTSVRTRVSGDIRMDPNRLTVQRATDDKVGSVRVFSASKAFKVLSVEDKSGLVSTKVTPEKGGKGYRLDVTLTKAGKKKESPISTRLMIKTSNKEQNELVLPIYYRRQNMNLNSGPKPIRKKMINKK